MKKFLLIAVFALGLHSVLAQVPSIEWQRSLGGNAEDLAYGIDQSSDGGYIIAGTSVSPVGGMISNNLGNFDYWIVKLSSLGALEWQKSLGGSETEVAHAVQQTSDGGYIIVGWTESNNLDVSGHYGSMDIWVVKLSPLGVIEWQKPYGGSEVDYGFDIQQTTDGGYIVVGETYSTNGAVTSGRGGWIFKLDSIGTIQWQATHGDNMNSVQQTSDGGFISAGYADGPLGNRDYHIVKLNSLGTMVWEKFYGGTASDIAHSIQQTSDGGYIIAGETNSSNTHVTQNNGSTDYWVIKLDSLGNLDWQKALGGSSNDYGQSVHETVDGGFVVYGHSNSNDGFVTANKGNEDSWMVKLDSTGSLVWQRTLGGPIFEYGRAVKVTSDGGYVIAASSSSRSGDVDTTNGSYDFWVVKLSANNTIGDNETSITPFKNQIVRAYPNPSKGFVFLESNIQGDFYFELVDNQGKIMGRGSFLQQTSLDVSSLKSGLYFLKTYLNGQSIGVDKVVVER